MQQVSVIERRFYDRLYSPLRDYLPKIGEKIKTTAHNIYEKHPRLVHVLSGYIPGYSDYWLINRMKHGDLENFKKLSRVKLTAAATVMTLSRYAIPIGLTLASGHPEVGVLFHVIVSPTYGSLIADDKSKQTSS